MKMSTKILMTLAVVLMLAILGGCENKASAPRSNNPEIRALVDGVLKEYGGEEAMRRIKGYRAEGTLQAIQRQVNVRTRRWFKRPDGLLLEIDYPGKAEWRLTLGKLGWTGPADGDWKPAGIPKIWPMLMQTARFDLPLRLREHETELEPLQKDAENRSVLRLTIGEGLHLEYHINPENHHIVTMMMVMDGPPAMVFQADYSEFKLVDGVLFPHREVTLAWGTVTSYVQIKSIVINPEDLDERVATPNSDGGLI